MYSNFTDWDSGLEHHGIPGMKWGVRKYQNRDGSLTPAGEKRYGSAGTGSSAKKTAKDLNKLDKSYANVEARRNFNAKKASKYALKFNRQMAKKEMASRKGKKTAKYDEKIAKNKEKALKYGLKAGEANRQKASIEKMQWKILGKASQQGYSVNSKPVKRMGKTGKQRIAGLFGAVGNLTYGAVSKGRGLAQVDGQHFTVKKTPRGERPRINVTNYAAAKKDAVRWDLRREQGLEAARRLDRVRR